MKFCTTHTLRYVFCKARTDGEDLLGVTDLLLKGGYLYVCEKVHIIFRLTQANASPSPPNALLTLRFLPRPL